MKFQVECIMMGGPELGRVATLRQAAARAQRTAIVAMDGVPCQCAAWRRNCEAGTDACWCIHGPARENAEKSWPRPGGTRALRASPNPCPHPCPEHDRA